MSYSRTQVINPAPGGDSVKQAALDLDEDMDNIFSDLNTHEALTATHGATGAVVGTTNTQTLTNKTLTSPKINENVALTATATELNFVGGVTSAIQAQILSALTNNSGATEPSTMYPFQFWADTTSGYMKQRNAANSAWITLYALNASAPLFATGAWTPIDASGAGLIFTGVSGGYFKIEGLIVVCWGELTYPTTANASLAQVGGLPFSIPNRNELHSGGSISFSTVGTAGCLYLRPGMSQAYVMTAGSGGITNATMSGGGIGFMAIYPLV